MVVCNDDLDDVSSNFNDVQSEEGLNTKLKQCRKHLDECEAKVEDETLPVHTMHSAPSFAGVNLIGEWKTVIPSTAWVKEACYDSGTKKCHFVRTGGSGVANHLTGTWSIRKEEQHWSSKALAECYGLTGCFTDTGAAAWFDATGSPLTAVEFDGL